MSNRPSNPPYFDDLLQQLQIDDGRASAAFGRHVHWGYWPNPVRQACSPDEYGAAAEALCEEIFDVAGVQDGMRILDVGCGFGGTLASLNERYSNLILQGVNIDARQLERARDIVRPRNSNRIEFVEADAACIPLPNHSCDVILAVECIFHFDRPRFFAEVARLLDSRGNLSLSDFVPSERAAEFIDTFDLSADPGIRQSFGDVDLSCSIERYRQLAHAHDLVLRSARDITPHTLPTYDFLYASAAGWADRRQAEAFTRATRLLDKASCKGMLGYQILKFDHGARTGLT